MKQMKEARKEGGNRGRKRVNEEIQGRKKVKKGSKRRKPRKSRKKAKEVEEGCKVVKEGRKDAREAGQKDD